jgi:hypothetical protein
MHKDTHAFSEIRTFRALDLAAIVNCYDYEMLLTHDSHVGALGHSFEIRGLCRNFAFIIAACVELKVDQGHPIHVRLLQLKRKKRRSFIQSLYEVYFIYATRLELILLPHSCDRLSQN